VLPASSVRKTTNEPMRAPLLAAVAASIFLTRLVKLSLTSRAKIIATGLPPLLQTRQPLVPAPRPVACSGLKAPGDCPFWGPDLRSAAGTAPARSSTAATDAARRASIVLPPRGE